MTTDVDLQAVTAAVQRILKAWGSDRLVDLHPLDSMRILRGSLKRPLPTPSELRTAVRQVIDRQLAELTAQDSEAARILQLRFLEGDTLLAVGHALNLSEHTVSRRQRRALEQLAQLICEREAQLGEQQLDRLTMRLPLPNYSRLIGFNRARDECADRLLRPDGPRLIALVGIGGIGKTALADAVAREAVGRMAFEEVVWIRVSPAAAGRLAHTVEQIVDELKKVLAPEAEASTLADKRLLLRQFMSVYPSLIVVDNLEDQAEASLVAGELLQLAGQGKIVITSRSRLDPGLPAYHFGVDALPPAAAAELLNAYAEEVNSQSWIDVGPQDIDAIYETVGGNPLALRLIVGLLDLMPLEELLLGLRRKRPGRIEEMYNHIYRYSWEILSDSAKTLLLAMPLVGEAGGTLDYLAHFAQVAEDRFWPALEELRDRSLIEVRGGLQEKRYGIHRLTATFLHQEILKRSGYAGDD